MHGNMRNVRGICMEFDGVCAWNMYGICMEYASTRMEYAWIFMQYVWNMHRRCMEYSSKMWHLASLRVCGVSFACRFGTLRKREVVEVQTVWKSCAVVCVDQA